MVSYTYYLPIQMLIRLQNKRGLFRISHRKMSDLTPKNELNEITEGSARIQTCGKVFYNPVQEFNRDLSISVLNVFSDEYLTGNSRKSSNDQIKPSGIRILEALSATGLRSIRYAKEVRNVSEIIANDFSKLAVQDIDNNIQINNVTDRVKSNCEDATMFMYRNRTEKFHAIDLDPYGCAAMFLDSAVQAIADDGLLLVTATDMAVLAGNTPETCYYKYGAISLRVKACHEMALRILLQCIESHANRYGRYIVPLLSISADFYIRVFVKVKTSAFECKKTITKLSHVYSCTGCNGLTLQPLGVQVPSKNPAILKTVLTHSPPVDEKCRFCGHGFKMGGPIWSAAIHDPEFVLKVIDFAKQTPLGTSKRIEGVLSVVAEEIDVPLYYTLDHLCSKLRLTTPSMIQFRSTLINGNYHVSYSHANQLSIKTNAPLAFIWNVLRSWARKNPPKNIDKLKETDPVAYRLLVEHTNDVDVNWDVNPHANPESRKLNLLRFQENPARNWGPGARSMRNTVGDTSTESASKQKRNQGKYKRKRSVNDDDDNSAPKPTSN